MKSRIRRSSSAKEDWFCWYAWRPVAAYEPDVENVAPKNFWIDRSSPWRWVWGEWVDCRTVWLEEGYYYEYRQRTPTAKP